MLPQIPPNEIKAEERESCTSDEDVHILCTAKLKYGQWRYDYTKIKMLTFFALSSQ